MSVPKSEKAKKLSLNKKEEESWFKRINYSQVIQRAGELYWNNKKRLLTIAILLVLTGGQAITFNSSFSGNVGGNGSDSPKNQNTVGNEDWKKTLDKIENEEDLKIKVREFFENEENIYAVAALVGVGFLILIAIALVLFFLNCHFHLLFINTVKNLEQGIDKKKKTIKKEIRGRWKKLALMRIIFGLVYFGCLALFMLPAAFFAWQKSWALAITMGGFSLVAIFIVFMMISYVFRYSLFYLALGKVSIKEAVDCGYEVFSKFWRESVLTSLINLGLGIAAMFIAFLVFLLSIIVFGIIAAIVGLIIYFVTGMAYAEGIAIGVGITLLLIPLIIIGIVIAAIWHGFVVIFWYLIFNQIAGCKVPDTVEEPVLAKVKKPAAKPVIQKEESE